MNGQWVGTYWGSENGLLVVEIDDMGDHYEGRAYAWNGQPALPSTLVFIRTPNKANESQLTVDVFPIDPRNNTPTTWDQLAATFPGVNFPRHAKVNISLDGPVLSVCWTTDIQTSGIARLPRTHADLPTEYKPISAVTNWDQFKSYVNRLDHRRYIFRGQKELLRLRTGFHRTARADLGRFLSDDIKALHRHLSFRTSHIFNLDIPDQNGAFFNLVQHHGYPTPLLDWTFSPYVAAFFAYHRVNKSEAATAKESEKVRILIFDQMEWRNKRQFPLITNVRPHFSILEFISIDNERLVPQQSISTVTNIDDVETYIRSLEPAGAHIYKSWTCLSNNGKRL